MQGDYRAARTLYEESLAIDRESGNEQGVASSLGNLGIIALEQGDLTLAKGLLEEALAINRRLDNPQGARPVADQSFTRSRQAGELHLSPLAARGSLVYQPRTGRQVGRRYRAHQLGRCDVRRR